MKRMFLITGLVIVSLMVMLGGCSPDKVAPPAAGAYSGTPATVRVSLSSSTIASGGAAAVTATVMDADASACPNISVTFSVISAASGTLSPVTVVTDASGVATTQFTAADVNATATIRAAVAVGTNTINDSAGITIGNPPRTPTAVSVSLSTAALPSTGGDTTVTATVTDSTGPISGVTVTFSASNASAGSLSATTATTNTSGIATVTYTANAGNAFVDVRASAGTLNNSATLQIGTPPPPTPASIVVVINPLSVGISSQATVNVTLRDANGSPAFNNAVTLTIISGASLASFSTGTLSTSTVDLTTNTSGVAAAPIYAGISSGAVTVQAAAGGLAPASASFFITSDPATISINIVNSNLTNGQTTNITANVMNIMNKAVSDGTTVNFAIASLPPFAGALSAEAASTVNGVASVTFTADPSITGGVIIQATAGTLPPAQSIIIVNAAQAGSLEFVSATPNIINIKGAGTSDSAVKFKVLSAAGAPLANQSVNFQLSIAPVGATLDTGGGPSSSGSTDSKGEVTTILHAGTVAGPVRIIATTTVSGPPVATLSSSSGNISIGGGVPSDRFFSVSVTKFNLNGMGCDNLQSTITALLADRFGNYNILQGTSVSFAADSGAIDTSNVTDALGATASVFRTQDPRPVDVDPRPGEPFYTAIVSGQTHTYNPRDGWLTILVSTTGEEYFQDNNANGVYDLGEPFTDLPEPFIDSNDNGVREVGELFFDWPAGVTGNIVGSYNGANGLWDAKIPIFREVNLVMTGPPAFGPDTTRVVSYTSGTTPNIIIPRGSSADFIVYVSDINMNALIGGTKVSMSSDKSEAKTAYVGGDSETLADGLSYGPAAVVYRVTNNNTSSPAVTVYPTISATIDWPGNCGRAGKWTINYPGIIVLP